MAKNRIITVQNVSVTVSIEDMDDYICITDMAAAKSDNSRAADVIKNWIRSRSTLEFLGTWEQIYNPNFKVVEFDHFKQEAGLHTFTLSVTDWVENTNAVGIYVKRGRYGIIHRDLHLGNILIKEGHVVLSDFGLSKDTMINHSLKSTSTPKNSHYFIEPNGLHDFTALDKLSDIYSIGKIIDYITSGSDLNKKLSFVISKATERNRAKRYTTMDEMIQDVNGSVKEISEEEKIQNIEADLQRGEILKDVEEFVMRLMRQEQLSNYIVRKQLYAFWKVLIQFNEIDQLALLGEIDRTYSEATGYGHFENYDLFAGIAYNVIRNSDNVKIQKKAYSVLEGCARYRYNASDYLNEINIYYPNITS